MGEIWRITTLGKLDIRPGHAPAPITAPAKAQALLVYLALTGRPHSRSALAGLLWGDSSEEAARASLRVTLNKLKPATGDLLIASWQDVGLNPACDLWLDAAALETAAAGSHLAWPEAVALYQGDFLADFYLPDAPLFEEWVALQRERLRQVVIDLLQRLVATAAERPDGGEGIRYARRLLTLDNWREEAHRYLMRLLALDGRRSEALAQFDACRRILAEELGVEPSAETIALYQTIKNEQITGRPPYAPDSPAALLSNLPAAATPFVGRQKELAQLADLLAQPEARLLVILGPGGMGKTRLALQAAAQQAGNPAFADGLTFVPLAAVAPAAGDPLISALAEALNLTFSDRRPAQEQLLAFLRPQRRLILLDNFEHLLDHTEILAAILAEAPGVKILVTSRQRLDLYEEWLLELTGLDLPASAPAAAIPPDLEQFSAVQLFIQRARRVHLGFDWQAERAAVVEICRLVEGLPLGIELAAAWVRTIPCREIAREIAANLGSLTGELRNVPERQRSLQATFLHSWRLLPPAEQERLAQLALFPAGFDREAAAAIAGATLRHLSGLADKSLLQRTATGRYELHSVIRHFALEQQDAAARAASQARHGRYYAAWMQARWQGSSQPQVEEAVRQIALELENLRAAWQWATFTGSLATLDQLLDPFSHFFIRRGRPPELLALLAESDRQLRAAGWADRPDTQQLLARLQHQLAKCLEALGRYQEAEQRLHASLPFLEQTNQPALSGDVWEMIGRVQRHLGWPAEADHAYRRALALYREAGLDHRIAGTLLHLGMLAKDAGRYQEAVPLYEEALAAFRRLGDNQGITVSLINLGNIANVQKEYQRAHDAYRQSYDLAAALEDRGNMAISLLNLGSVARATGDVAAAQRYYEESLHLGRAMERGMITAAALDGLGQTMLAAGNFPDARRYLHQALTAAQSLRAEGMILVTVASAGRALFLDGHPTALPLLAFILAQPNTFHYVKEEVKTFLAEQGCPAEAAGNSPLPAGLDAAVAQALQLLTIHPAAAPE